MHMTIWDWERDYMEAAESAIYGTEPLPDDLQHREAQEDQILVFAWERFIYCSYRDMNPRIVECMQL